MGAGWLSGRLLWEGWERKAVGVRIVFIASSWRFGHSESEEATKKLATPTCQELGWPCDDTHNLLSAYIRLGASCRCWLRTNADNGC